MNESQRQAYLSAMGIQPYYSRRSIAGAKASPVYEFTPAPRELAAATREASPVAETTRPAARAAAPAPRERRPRTEAVAPPASVASTPQAPVATVTGNELRFRLNYYRISDDIAVIDEVPHQQARRDVGATISLLHAILQALTIDCSAVTFDPDSFNWPFAEGFAMKNDSAAEARKALCGFIAMRHQTDRFRHLVIFAAQVEELLQAPAQKSNRDYMDESGQYHITLTHSLQSILTYPALKRDVWSHLQALRRRLTRTSGTTGA